MTCSTSSSVWKATTSANPTTAPISVRTFGMMWWSMSISAIGTSSSTKKSGSQTSRSAPKRSTQAAHSRPVTASTIG